MSRARFVSDRRARGPLALAALLVLASCSGQTPPPQPASFDRPGRVAFVCFQTNGRNAPKPLPLRICANASNEAEGQANLAMHAVVTQTSHGEVAAVDLEGKRVLDSRNDIPGYTFLPVGEQPSAVVIPREHPLRTYVANFGSRNITVLRTVAFRKLGVGETATVQTVPVRLPGASTLAAPVDLAVSPDEDALFIALPDAHAVMRMPIRRCAAEAAAASNDDAGATSDDAGTSCEEGSLDAAAATLLPLERSATLATTASAPALEPEPYAKICKPETLLPLSKGGAAIAPVNDTNAEPEPVGFATDDSCKTGDGACHRRLLIADRSLPFVHVIDLDLLAQGSASAAVLPPIATGAPTSDVVVTPRVPKTIADTKTETQYVYAIDARDGSVIATENGKVLAVSSDPNTPVNRIGLGRNLHGAGNLRATALAVLSPSFDTHAAAAQYITDEDADAYKAAHHVDDVPSDAPLCVYSDNTDDVHVRLHGVFLAVGASDGTVRIVDVHDMELAKCRSCGGPVVDPFPVVRNRVRIATGLASNATEEPSLAPVVNPTFGIGSDVFFSGVDGTTPDPRVEGLSCLPCKSPLDVAFPDPRTVETANGTALDAGTTVVTDAAANNAEGDVLDAAQRLEDASSATPDENPASGAGVTDTDAGAAARHDPIRPGLGRRCDPGSARVCALADPWTRNNSWNVIFEGPIPGAQGGHGRFVEPGSADNQTGKLELASEVAFCGKGVLGNDVLGKEAHAGDQVVITGQLPPLQSFDSGKDKTLRDDCEKLVAPRESGDFPIAFAIASAHDDRLVLEDRLLVPSADLDLPSSRKLDHTFVASCFQNMLLTFEVHTRRSYAVRSQKPNDFMNRVKADASGRCVIDTSKSAQRQGRAYEDLPFDNGQIAFQIASRLDDDMRPRRARPLTTLTLQFGEGAAKAFTDATSTQFEVIDGVMARDLRFNDIDQRLYMVDMTARGLVPIGLNPLFPTVPTSFQ